MDGFSETDSPRASEDTLRVDVVEVAGRLWSVLLYAVRGITAGAVQRTAVTTNPPAYA